jgi:hypothetical protein
MLTKATIAILGTVIASAVTALPFASPEIKASGEPLFTDLTDVASLARKGDRLRVVGNGCEGSVTDALCADIFGASGAPQTVTYQRRIGESISVVFRLPVRSTAARK